MDWASREGDGFMNSPMLISWPLLYAIQIRAPGLEV